MPISNGSELSEINLNKEHITFQWIILVINITKMQFFSTITFTIFYTLKQIRKGKDLKINKKEITHPRDEKIKGKTRKLFTDTIYVRCCMRRDKTYLVKPPLEIT